MIFYYDCSFKKVYELMCTKIHQELNSGFALAVRVEHWTPKGDCTERGDKERSDQKKVHQKIDEIFSQKASLAVM